MQLVVFTLGTGTYALPIGRVQEIIRDRPRTAGVISLRGRLLPVRDVAAQVGAGALTTAARAPRRQPSRKRSEKATRSTGGAKTGSPSKVTA